MANGILGLRDSESDSANRFKNWRRRILYEFPNGEAPLTALLSLTEAEETNDPEFNWFEKPLPTQRTALTASYNDTDGTIHIAASVVRVGHMLMNESTDERFLVTSVDSTGLVIGVHRGEWGAAAASTGTDDAITVVGNANPEGGETPQIITYDPNPFENYTQIFRTPFGATGTYLKTSLKYDKSGPYVEKLREALNLHSIEMEKAFIFGKKSLFVDPSTNETLRTMDGVITRLPAANVINLATGSNTVGDTACANAADTINQDVMDSWLELLFRVSLSGRREKLVLGGSGALKTLNTLAKKGGEIQLVATDDAFGFQFRRYLTPQGTLYFYDHPLMSQHPTWRYWMLGLDVHGLKYRYLTGRDTRRLTNRQNNGADKRIDEFMSECSLEFQHVAAHGLLKSVKKAA